MRKEILDDIDVKATSKKFEDGRSECCYATGGNLGGTKEVKFGDGKKVKVKPQIAQRVMSKMMTLRQHKKKRSFNNK